VAWYTPVPTVLTVFTTAPVAGSLSVTVTPATPTTAAGASGTVSSIVPVIEYVGGSSVVKRQLFTVAGLPARSCADARSRTVVLNG